MASIFDSVGTFLQRKSRSRCIVALSITRPIFLSELQTCRPLPSQNALLLPALDSCWRPASVASRGPGSCSATVRDEGLCLN